MRSLRRPHTQPGPPSPRDNEPIYTHYLFIGVQEGDEMNTACKT